MASRSNHPLKMQENGRQVWNRHAVIEVLLPRLAEMSLPDACSVGHEGRGLPSATTVGFWLKDDPQLAALVARAREARAENLVEESLKIADSEPERGADGRIDGGAVRWSESRIKSRQWVAERLNRKQWGSQVQVDMTVHGSIDIVSVLAEARGRVIEGRKESPIAIDCQPADDSDIADFLD